MKKSFLSALSLGLCVLASNAIYGQTQWLQGGNAFGATGVLGTTDNNNLDIYTNNQRVGRWLPNGNLLINTTTDAGATYKLQVAGSVTTSGLIKAASFYGAPFTAFADAGPGWAGGNATNFLFAGNHQWANNSATPIDFVNIYGEVIYNANLSPGNFSFLSLNPKYSITATALNATIRGIYYNPQIGSFTSGRHIAIETVAGDVLFGTTSGSVGIGTSQPTALLHAAGTVRFSGLTKDNTKTLVIASDANGNLFYKDASALGGGWGLTGNPGTDPAASFLGTTDNNPLAFRTNNAEQMRIDAAGNVGIGTTAPQSKLAVKGTITTQKIVVTQTGWADYVFEPSYRLSSLPVLERFIQEHKHLPEVPSASEIAKDGNDIGANQVAMLKKIEELTLYVIKQDKELKALQKEVRQLRHPHKTGK